MNNKTQSRRHFISTAAASAMAIAGAPIIMSNTSIAANDLQMKQNNIPTTPSSSIPLGPIKQIDAGVLNIGYVDAGPAGAPVVILLHGWPYDINSFGDVVPLLIAKGYRVIVPHLRGHGTTRFLNETTPRNAQQSALAADVIDLMNALKIQKAVVGGFDWGSRTANILAALWPDRIKGLVAVSGYNIVNLADHTRPLPPKWELSIWYFFYFATERGRQGYDVNRHDFNKLIWTNASPKWQFDDTTYERSATSFNNPDHTAIVVHSYRWRLSLAPGETKYAELEKRLSEKPAITVPTITIASDFDGPLADGKTYASRYTGRYTHRILRDIGHNVPQEAPEAFTDAILTVDSY